MLKLYAFVIPVLMAGIILAQDMKKGPVDYVDPLIGTEDGGGAAFPGACLPFSMVRLGPDTPLPQNTSGYVPGGDIDGFSHMHVSGTGGPGKYGNIMVIPQSGQVLITNYTSAKSEEKASPGYYSVILNRQGIKAELTADERTGFHRYTFPAGKKAYVLFDLSRAINVVEFAPGHSINAYVKKLDEKKIEGYGTYGGGWGPEVPYTVYFYAEFDRHISESGTWRNGKKYPGSSQAAGDSVGIYLGFDGLPENKLVLKVGISVKSLKKAKENFEKSSAKSFDEAHKNARKTWNEYLSKIEVQGGSEEDKIMFYTCLQRSMLMPTNVTGENPMWDSYEPHYWDYFALWDTHRTLHPLLTLILPERQTDMIRSLVDVYEHTGWMPECWTSGVHGLMQGGTSCDVVIADAMVKGLKGFDYQKAYEAIKKNADVPSDAPREYGRDSDEYLELGYSSSNKWCGSSRTIEYAYNDFCVSQAAEILGKTADKNKYRSRSLNSYNLFMPEEKFFWAKNPDGSWVEGFDPEFRIEEWWEGPYFYEGLPWHYLFMIPHDIGGLMRRHGGRQPFLDKLDEMFDGGHYTQDNQPDIMTPYLYAYAGRPDKTAERVRHIFKTDYSLTPDGLPGQDDAGCMSSWYVFSAMGFYPNAGQDIYFLGSPLFEETTLQLGEGKTLTIRADNVSDKNIYIQSAKINGGKWDKPWFRHSDISNGGVIELEMGPSPSAWGKASEPPPSVSDNIHNIPEPGR